MKTLALVLTCVLAVLPAGAQGVAPQVTASLQGDAARPESAHWLRAELYFGVGRVDDPSGGISEAQWRQFLDREVTPRFPDGLTVFDAYGQWRTRGHDIPSRLRSKVLVILMEDTPANRAGLDSIRLAWKGATHHQSVLLAVQPAEVSF